MNYRKKWRTELLRQLKEKGRVEISTRQAADIAALDQMREEGLISTELIASGVWLITPPVKGETE